MLLSAFPFTDIGMQEEICCFGFILAFLLHHLISAMESLMCTTCEPWYTTSTFPISGICCFVALPTFQHVIKVVGPKGHCRTGLLHEAIRFWARIVNYGFLWFLGYQIVLIPFITWLMLICNNREWEVPASFAIHLDDVWYEFPCALQVLKPFS